MSQPIVEQPSVVAALSEQLVRCGVSEVVLCAGKRNAAIVKALSQQNLFRCYYCSEERSSAFFALGCARRSGCPTAVVTTSGTAAGELLPALMEAYYSSVPLLAITGDRPRRYRASGAPQCAEQRHLFGCYAHVSLDIDEGDPLPLSELWHKKGPAHVNVSLEDPAYAIDSEDFSRDPLWWHAGADDAFEILNSALSEAKYPFVIVGELLQSERAAVRRFLLDHSLPHHCESHSGLREDSSLAETRIHVIDKLWQRSSVNDYPIDLILRLGGVPTMRPWRDLEELQRDLPVLSISAKPFSGLSRGGLIIGDPPKVLGELMHRQGAPKKSYDFSKWREADLEFFALRQQLLQKWPLSEPSLFYRLSQHIPVDEMVYLGNSMPIREWDLAADIRFFHDKVFANRGLNGIDGQLSTFLGLCPRGERCWGIFGDLTTMYDLAAPWFLGQKEDILPVIVIINNGGGKIFARHFKEKEFQNCHDLSFKSLAQLWNIQYLHLQHLSEIPLNELIPPAIIEIVPNEAQTEAFWNEYKDC